MTLSSLCSVLWFTDLMLVSLTVAGLDEWVETAGAWPEDGVSIEKVLDKHPDLVK